MQNEVQAAVPVLYVRGLEAAQAFYALFGYGEMQSGHDGDGDAAWSYLQCGSQTLLLACVRPAPVQAELPLLIYLYVADLAGVQARLEQAGHAYEPVEYPDHAPGGQLRTLDPDGNGVLVGQRSAVPGMRAPGGSVQARVSLIKQAAEAFSGHGGAPSACQVGAADGTSCARPAEIKLADTWGTTVWGCLTHAEEALINAPSAFIAAEEAQGLGPWLGRRTAAG
ncbi:VOC family protein [Actinoplanes sp. N902-109]|uniref:VOC family protein n=1 Tax=Actinoplanes sp. (strain N902-109) TaxID=649831 RepID=UPI00039F3A23|nr:guanylate cyclase [Actinoplanes sp. N902-109]